MAGMPGVQAKAAGPMNANAKPKQVGGQDLPHTESVTGKVTATGLQCRQPHRPKDDDPPPKRRRTSAHSALPLIRRITTVAPKDGA